MYMHLLEFMARNVPSVYLHISFYPLCMRSEIRGTSLLVLGHLRDRERRNSTLGRRFSNTPQLREASVAQLTRSSGGQPM